MKKYIAILIFILTLVCLSGCGSNLPIVDCDEPVSSSPSSIPKLPGEENKPEAPITQMDPIFKTEEVVSITLYKHYGSDMGSEVPVAYMEEMIAWLNSFELGEVAPEILPPGTNTYWVEMQYVDRSTVRKGIDAVTIDGVTYYTKHNEIPDCFYEILSYIDTQE